MEFKKNYLFNIFLKLGTVKIGLISLGLLFLSIFTLFLKKNLISLKFDLLNLNFNIKIEIYFYNCSVLFNKFYIIWQIYSF